MTTVTVQQAFELALAHHRAGRLREAEAVYRQILAQSPEQPETLYFLGLIARQTNRPAEAAALWRRATVARPDQVEWLFQLAWALLDSNEPYQAISVARQATQRQPDFADAHAILGRALAAVRKFDEAVGSARRAVELARDNPEMRNHLGLVLKSANELREAEAEFLQAIELNPRNPHYHRNLAAARDALDDVDGSIAAAEECRRLGGEDVQLLSNLAALHRRRRAYTAALAMADRALALQPNHPESHGSRAIALLAMGDYAQGFVEYEWRWRCDNFTTRTRDFGRPMWDGSDPRGRRIFVHTEQGYGDTLQFERYVALLAARGAEVILETHPSLRTLLRRVAGVSKVVPSGMNPPDFDLHTPLLSMPKWFRTTLENLPNQVPYVTPDPARVQVWKDRIDAPATNAMNVGLVWSGNVQPDPNRTCRLANLVPLAHVADTRFFSLQIGEASREIATVAGQMSITDLSKDLTDFHETAAAMQCLDLILTIDTAAAHLAGALGRPVWTLLPWAADWRWLSDREDSPWYPTMRLFRQSTKGDWAEPVERVRRQLSAFHS